MPNPYTISLLNDLHHFFPELLYRPERFQTVQDVLCYVIRVATHESYEDYRQTYERARQAYRGREEESKESEFISSSASTSTPSSTSTPASSSPSSSSSSTSASVASDSIASLLGFISPRTPLFQRSAHRTRIAFPLSSSESSLASFLLGSGSGSGLESLFQPVMIRPTDAHLESNTHLHVLEETGDVNCSICQDPMEAGQEIRTLLVCCHSFHRTCVDQWFQEHVTCPTCRHDVREEF